MKLTIWGGGGMRMPAFVRAVLAGEQPYFGQICLFEPDPVRRWAMCRLAMAIASRSQAQTVVEATGDIEEACTGADFVFSAIRVGGDRGRVIDEQVALAHGLVGQETTGAGGCAMALRTIPVVLSYCSVLARCAPGAVLINFTNPAGTITQAITGQTAIKAVGVCDTPSSTIDSLGRFLGAGEPGSLGQESISYGYGGLNHLGWVTSLRLAGEERIGEVLSRYEQLQHFDHTFAAFEPDLVRRLGAVPTEYLFYYYDALRYVRNVTAAGTTRGQDVVRINEAVLGPVGQALDDDDVDRAWAAYAAGLGARRNSYMTTDVGTSPTGPPEADAGHEDVLRPGGYEALALSVVEGLAGGKPKQLVVNIPNGASLDVVAPDDVVEAPAMLEKGMITALPSGRLPRAASGLVAQVKEYERAIVDAAVTGDASLAAIGLSLHPLVPGLSAGRELLNEYREAHGADLSYLR